MRWALRILAVLMLCALPAAAQQAPKRIALVIGNADYQTPAWKLVNPVRDANLMAGRLRAGPFNFQVTLLTNATRAQMDAARNTLVAQLRAGGEDSVGVFYYAGHAAEHDGANLLVPVEVNVGTMDELRDQAPPLSFLLRDLARIGNKVNIVILDACRNTPLPSGTRDGPEGGLALDEVPDNVLIAYATRPGQTAPDNPGDTNSIFTRTLTETLAATPDAPVESLFATVQSRVFEKTGRVQRPEFRAALLRAPGWRFASVGGTIAVSSLKSLNTMDARVTLSNTRAPIVRNPAQLADFALFRECDRCPEMVILPAGEFQMGSNLAEEGRGSEEWPRSNISISRFAISRFETTWDEWRECVLATICNDAAQKSEGGDHGWGMGRRPVIEVDWYDSKRFADWVNERAQTQGYRLPTEAEWEFAARSGTQGAWSFGPLDGDLAGYAWYLHNSNERTHPVGQRNPNPSGLFDMYGNVWEWVEDCYRATLYGQPSDGSVYPSDGCSTRVVRGGAWNSPASETRSAARSMRMGVNRQRDRGFRLARSLH